MRALTFGKRSERRDPDYPGQEDLFNEAEQTLNALGVDEAPQVEMLPTMQN